MELRMEMTSNRTITGRHETTLRYVAAGLAVTSELIHLWMVPSEFVIAPLRGLSFALVAACQGLLAISLLLGPSRRALRFGILLNLGLVTVWVMTRFTSLPILPSLLGFTRLPVGALDLVATATEIALLVLLFRLRQTIPSNKRKRYMQ